MLFRPRSPRIAWAILLLLFTAPLFADEPKNLLPNASFETVNDQSPADWKTNVWQGGESSAAFTASDEARTGDHCLKIIGQGDGTDASCYVEVPVQPNTMYRLSGWIKTDDVQTNGGGRGALLNIHNLQAVRTDAVSGTEDWTEVSAVFNSGAADTIWVNCLLGGWGRATGVAYFDDVAVQELSLADLKPTVSIDATKRAEPMPVYVYGQFIEHLGRCIYGGIWAEMLLDRKFYYPITDKFDPYGGRGPTEDLPFPVLKSSPWKSIGPKGSVTMVKEDSFVGEHTPVVTASSKETREGIQQGGLGVKKGRKYTGYAWLKAEGDLEDAVVMFVTKGIAQPTPFKLTDKYTKCSFSFTAAGDDDDAKLIIYAVGQGKLYIGTASLMPADNVNGMRADTLELLKELDSPVYRWPGGNFVSGYDWKDGIGDRDRRPPRKNPAWTGVEHNDFGLDEFMVFCKLLDTEPYIAVNTGLGGVENAVAELEYANGGADTPMGKLRAENGHAGAYKVKWWGIGNEMYGSWQLGNVPLEQYIKRHNAFADAFYAKDPSVKLVAVGDAGRWSEGMMEHCADGMDLISEHFYCQDGGAPIAHVRQIPNAIRAKAEAHRRYRERFDALDGKDIRIAMDEWNYWYGPHPFGELGTRYFLKDALGIAAGVNEYARNTDIVFMANYAQTVNVIGCIKTDKTDAAFATTGLVLKLYRDKFGVIPLETKSQWPLDVQAALTEDERTLTVSVINPTGETMAVPLSINGLELKGQGVAHEIAGDDPMAYNEPGKAPKVEIVTRKLDAVGDTLEVKPYSATVFELPIK